jgi:hypothetical protein
VPEDAYEIKIVHRILKVDWLNYTTKMSERAKENIHKTAIHEEILPICDNVYKLLGTATKDTIDFDCEPYLDKNGKEAYEGDKIKIMAKRIRKSFLGYYITLEKLWDLESGVGYFSWAQCQETFRVGFGFDKNC